MGEGRRRGGEERQALPVASLAEIARVLDETARLLRRHPAALAEGGDDAARRIGLQLTPAIVRAVIEARRRRAAWLGLGAGDPAWSMMLELYAARLEDRGISQNRLGAAAGVTQTTAQRLIRRFLAGGLFTQGRDPTDRRLLVIGLADDTAARVGAYLSAAMTASPYVP